MTDMSLDDLDRAAGEAPEHHDDLTPPWAQPRVAMLIFEGLTITLADGTPIRVKGRPPIHAVKVAASDAPGAPSQNTLMDAGGRYAAYPIYRAPGADRYGPLAFTDKQDAIDAAEAVSKWLEGGPDGLVCTQAG